MSSERIKPRQYQTDILEYVLKRNTIVYLPTGAGKTHLAIMALNRFAKYMEEPIKDGGKRAIFMCNTVELVRQQITEIQKYSNLKIGACTSDQNVESRHWREKFIKYQVLVGTPPLFLQMFVNKVLNITDLCIVIVDECHHATKGHPVCEIMRLLNNIDNANIPRVLGLTGVLIKGNHNLNNVTKPLNELELTYRAKIITASSKNELDEVVAQPKERLLLYGADFQATEFNEQFELILTECFNLVENFDIGTMSATMSKGLNAVRDPNKKVILKKLLSSLRYHLFEYGLYCANFVLERILFELKLKQQQAESGVIRNLYNEVISKLNNLRELFLSKLRDQLLAAEESNDNEDYHKIEVIVNCSTPKVLALLHYFEKNFVGKERQDIACLIFIEQRMTAKAITSVIQKFIAETPNLKNVLFPDCIVRQNDNNTMDYKSNLVDFRKGKLNLIICSDVLEEGIDIQACNYVLVFDRLKTLNSYFQTKGRARAKNSIFTIVASINDELIVRQQIRNYKRALQSVEEFLMERLEDSTALDELKFDNKIIEKFPLLKSPNGACLTASSALRLLHQYCQTLPWDSFGPVLPYYKKIIISDNDGKNTGVVVTVRLPLQSQVKEEVKSDCMKNTKLAKISAAFKICQRLCDEGEVNDKFLPISQNDCIQAISKVLFKHWEYYDDDVSNPKIGRAKKRSYEEVCPEELYNALPKLGGKCFIYAIKFTPDFKSNDYNAHVFKALTANQTFGILLSKKLPLIAEMPLFMQQGSLKVKISENPYETIIDKYENLAQLKRYHLMLWRDILQIWQNFYVLDRRNKQHSYLIVPLKNDNIDFELVQSFQQLDELREPSYEERKAKVYKPEDWLGKIVGKWYGLDTSTRYVVTEVLTDQTPLSKFPIENTEFKTYEEFYEQRYGEYIKEIFNKEQFLLKVRALTSRRNFFNNSKSKNRIILRETQKIVLVPELCHNFKHPADLWLKALLLPSILHRLHFMLHAEHLRIEVNSFLGFKEFFKDYKPKPLIIDQSLRRAVDCGHILSPTNRHEIESLENSKLFLLKTTSKYLKEPLNVKESIYPLELQLYSDFKLKYEKSSHFKQDVDPQHVVIKNSPCNILDENNAEVLTEKLRIDILERSLNDQVSCAEQFEFLAALTTAYANDVFDMERFELLGDAFLKFSVSLFLLYKYPRWHEGFLSTVRSKMVSNQNLLYCLLGTNIPSQICSNIFLMSNWLPPLVSLPSNLFKLFEEKPDLINKTKLNEIKLSDEEIFAGTCEEHHLEKLKNINGTCKSCESDTNNDIDHYFYKLKRSDKVNADTLEAILGVCVKNYGIRRTFAMLEFFGICPAKANEQPLINLLELDFNNILLSPNLNSKEVDEFLTNYKDLETNLNYKFQNRAYLLQALTHPSYPTNRLTGCYQKLEFIGDAILDILVSCYIFERNESKTPGMLTNMRMALVNNAILGCVCVRHRFHLSLLHENAALAESIRIFAEFQKSQNYRSTNLLRILLEEGECLPNGFTANIADSMQVPKVLGDIVESIIAAVYFDSRDLRIVWHVIYKLLQTEIKEINEEIPIDSVSELYEHPSAKPIFSNPITNNEYTLVKCNFQCKGKTKTANGFGTNKIQAKKSAAKHALKILKKM